MHTHYFRLATILVVATFFLSACESADLASEDTAPLTEDIAPATGTIIPGQYIVVLKDHNQLAGKTMKEVFDQYEAMDGIALGHRYSNALNGFSAELTSEAADLLRNDPLVEYIEEDKIITLPPFSINGLCDRKPDHPNCQGGGGDPDPTQVTPWGITRVNGGADGTGKVAWVIDSGIDQDHPDLNVDTGRSQSFLSGKQGDNPDDQHGHGSHVAGTIAAIDNNVGVIGVAAGATVVAVRVLDRRGSGSTSGVIAGVDYVAANANSNDVANMSLGGGVSTALDNAVVVASNSVPFTLAAGNESDDANNHSPARANGNNIYTICATTSSDGWSSFSNYSQSIVDYCEPGSGIESTFKNGGYKTYSGTSMAAPHAAGILLLGNISNGGSVSGPDGSYTIGSH